MTQFWSVNYTCQVSKLKLLFWTCLKFWAIFILIGSYFELLLNTFYRESTAIVFGTVLFYIFWRFWKLVFWRKYFQSLFIFMLFFYLKTINFHNSGIVGKLVYNIPSHLNDLILAWSAFYNNAKRLVVKFKVSAWNFPIFETGRNYNSLFKLADNNWVIVMKQI